MKHIILPILLLFCGCQQNSQQTKEVDEVININTQEMSDLLNNDIQVIDVRTLGEVENGMIEGARHFDFLNGDFEEAVPEFDKKKPIVVYCQAGGRSAKAAKILKDKGFNTVYNYTDGYSGWPK